VDLLEDLRRCRVDRPDEWTMDRFIRKAGKLLQEQKELITIMDAGDELVTHKWMCEFVADSHVAELRKRIARYRSFTRVS